MTKISMLSDASIFLSYIALGAWLLFLVHPKFTLLRFMFGLFIVSCGNTHLNSYWATLHGRCDVYSYWANACKIETAVVSVITVILVVCIAYKDPAFVGLKRRD